MKEKIKISYKIIESGIKTGGNQIVWFTGGKDSAVLLHLTRQVNPGIKACFIDTGFKFGETLELIKKTPNCDIAYPAENCQAVKENAERCCYERKSLPIINYTKHNNITISYVAIRWDEGTARAEEIYFKQIDGYTRIHPLLHWTRKDIWDFIHKNKIVTNKLYQQGYTSLGCECCTTKPTNRKIERSGRNQDKEGIMVKLRNGLGYF